MDEAFTQVGKYEILRHIASGGMADLYLARMRGMTHLLELEGHRFEKLVVVKRILRKFSNRADVVRMFLDEARIAATLQHENIAHVYEVGQHGSDLYLAMEYLHGVDVNRIMRKLIAAGRTLPFDHAVQIAIGALAGLHHAHQHQVDGHLLDVVHRDVSPSNLLVTFEGCTKLLDFGIVKATVSPESDAIMGKLRYMSPEQCRGEKLDRGTDIYSLAVVLWEMTCNRALFFGTQSKIVKKVSASEIPPPSSVRADYPPELERIVMKALARRRADRYSTAQEMQLELESFARERKLVISSVALASFMKELFAPMIEEGARARSNPSHFIDYVAHALEEGATAKQGSADATTAPAGSRDAETYRSPRSTLPSALVVASVAAGLALGVTVFLVVRPGRRPPIVRAAPAPAAPRHPLESPLVRPSSPLDAPSSPLDEPSSPPPETPPRAPKAKAPHDLPKHARKRGERPKADAQKTPESDADPAPEAAKPKPSDLDLDAPMR